ncbi:MAG: SHOCT domain-containing protein [Phycisphaerales bacterium JB059]
MHATAHIPGPSLVLAQARPAPPTELWLWVGALIVVSLVFGFVVMAMRRRLLGKTDEGVRPASLLEDLRAMRDRGEISQDEYDSTRATIAARAAGREPPAKSPPAAPDGSLMARPGYDLTGERLPAPADPPESVPGREDKTPRSPESGGST